MGAQTRLTYAELRLLPEDGKRHEIIGGQQLMTPSPSMRHERIFGNIFSALRQWAKAAGAGEVFGSHSDVVLSDEDVVVPDVLFISTARASILTEKNVQGAPDLIVEILSPSTRRTDMIRKRALYEAHGVREYWIVDPDRETVIVHRAAESGGCWRAAELSLESGDSLKTPLLPGFSLPLAEIFG